MARIICSASPMYEDGTIGGIVAEADTHTIAAGLCQIGLALDWKPLPLSEDGLKVVAFDLTVELRDAAQEEMDADLPVGRRAPGPRIYPAVRS